MADEMPNHGPSNIDLLITLTRMETKVDEFLGKVKDHESRIRKLEQAKWPLPSIGILLTLASTAIAATVFITR